MPLDTGVRATSAWSDGEYLLPSDGVPESVASAYNGYFISCRERNEEGDITDDCLLYQISETIVTALHTRSGWHCLHRKSEAVFIQVNPTPASDTRRLTVRVSDIYTPDGTVSILDELCALFQSCKVAEDIRLKQFGDIATRLMSCTAQRYGRSTRSIEMKNGGEGTTDESLDHLSLTSSERIELHRAMLGETLLILIPGELARFFLANCPGDLGCGRSGYVVRSCVDGANFAVRRWNMYESDIHNSMDGLRDLRYEVQIYAYLHTYHPDVLGRIVPRLLVMCEEMDTKNLREYSLVLTMVGEHIERTKNVGGEKESGREVWTLNGEELIEQDISEIKRKAEKN